MMCVLTVKVRNGDNSGTLECIVNTQRTIQHVMLTTRHTTCCLFQFTKDIRTVSKHVIPLSAKNKIIVHSATYLTLL